MNFHEEHVENSHHHRSWTRRNGKAHIKRIITGNIQELSLSRKEWNAKIKCKSSLSRLDPMIRDRWSIDEQGTVRVGGWLENFALPFSDKYPIVLTRRSQITRLIKKPRKSNEYERDSSSSRVVLIYNKYIFAQLTYPITPRVAHPEHEFVRGILDG